MIYLYECPGCSERQEIVKPVAEYEREELCPKSMVTMHKVFTPTQLFGTAVQDKYYNWGLGLVVDHDRHARQIARDRGLIEIGNEKLSHIKPPPPKEYE